MNSLIVRDDGKRLVYYRKNMSSQKSYWDAHWINSCDSNKMQLYEKSTKGFLGRGVLRSVLLRYLPKKGLILEGGCGMAQYVIALRAKGYNCIGVDFAQKTIERVKEIFPNLPVEKGDICQLYFPDSSIDAYISLGVMEHFKEGPMDALSEAHRVLKKGGILIVSIPQLFPWRRLEVVSADLQLPSEFTFYQYAFSPNEFKNYLKLAGFVQKAQYGYHSFYGLKQRFIFLNKLQERYPKLSLLGNIFDLTPLWRVLARMRLFIVQKM